LPWGELGKHHHLNESAELDSYAKSSEQVFENGRRHHEQVDRGNAAGMILNERPPAF